jgi:ribosomal protein S18 acetylase RimI-like enzyme
MIPEALNRRAADLGVSLQQGRHELVDELEPLWLSMFDHHLSTGAAGLPVIRRAESWARRRALYGQLLRGQETFVIVARRGAAAVGYAVAHVHLGADDTWDTGDLIGEVESLAVLPLERGRGLGTLLLDCVEAVLDRLGARDVMIGVLAGNDDAQRFYERRGMAPAIVKLLRVGPKPSPEPGLCSSAEGGYVVTDEALE